MPLLFTDPYLLIYAGLLGLLIGSFLNVVILRVPHMLMDPSPTFNLITPASHCPQCSHVIGVLENIPVLSYVFLLGRCKACKTSISIRYPFIELLTALLTVLTVSHFGFSLASGFAIVLVWSLIASSFIDLDHQIIPDDITLPILWLGLFANIFSIFTPPQNAILGAIAGYLSLWTIYWIFKLLTKKEGMGYGDFKLLALLGAWLGWQALPLIILLSSLLGSMIGLFLILIKKHTRSDPMPFGPYLALAGFIALLWGPTLNIYYLSFLSFF